MSRIVLHSWIIYIRSSPRRCVIQVRLSPEALLISVSLRIISIGEATYLLEQLVPPLT